MLLGACCEGQGSGPKLAPKTCTSFVASVPSPPVGMRVGEVARRTGVSASTLRAWERRFGLLQPQRSPGQQRLYDDADVERVAAVRRLVDEGLSLPAAVARVRSAGAAAVPTGEGESLFFGQILQAANQAVWVAKDGRTRYANRKMTDLLGCSLDELLSRSVFDFVDPERMAATRERVHAVRLGGRERFEIELRRADGSTVLAEMTTSALQDRAGRYEGAVAFVTDITARKEAETQALFRAALLEAVGEAVVAADLDGTITYVNQAAAELFGWSAAEAVGQTADGFPTAIESADKLADIYEQVMAGHTFSGDLPMVRRDGTRFVGHLTGAPVIGDDGGLVGMIGVIRDVTEGLELGEELRTEGLRRSAVAVLGARALAKGRDIAGAGDAVLDECVEATRRLVGVDRAALLEVGPDATLAVLTASPAVDAAAVAGGSRSLAGYTVLARGVVAVEDTTTERRFEPGSLAGDTRAAIAAPVFGPRGVRAVLTAESSTVRHFDRGAADFLQAIANVVGAALE
ncbi:MAG: PAS domain S-box protein [Actinobacteria bacterium]|nr:MAG: PAS domain S-box protein [Actinomycetota bacterium]